LPELLKYDEPTSTKRLLKNHKLCVALVSKYMCNKLVLIRFASILAVFMVRIEHFNFNLDWSKTLWTSRTAFLWSLLCATPAWSNVTGTRSSMRLVDLWHVTSVSH